MIYRILGILILLALVLVVFLESKNAKAYQAKENMYGKLRSIALSTTAQKLELSLPGDKIIVYGVLMDWGMKDGIASTIAYQTGDASMYLSSGGGVIGGKYHEKVNAAARHFVAIAQQFISRSMRTNYQPLPQADDVYFYLLTNHGIYMGQESMKNFENNSSQWLPLFEAGNEVISELRKVTPSQK